MTDICVYIMAFTDGLWRVTLWADNFCKGLNFCGNIFLFFSQFMKDTFFQEIHSHPQNFSIDFAEVLDSVLWIFFLIHVVLCKIMLTCSFSFFWSIHLFYVFH